MIIASITDPKKIDSIINHLVTKGRPPPGIAACCNMAFQRIFALIKNLPALLTKVGECFNNLGMKLLGRSNTSYSAVTNWWWFWN